MIDRRQEGKQRLRDRQNGKRGRKEGQGLGEGGVRRVCAMRRRERSVSWYRVREVDGSGDSALVNG